MAAPLTQVANRAYPRRDTSIPHLLAEVTGVNILSLGATNLYTVPAGLVAIWQRIVIRPTTVVGLTSAPTLGVGINPTYDDVVFPLALTGIAANTYWSLPLLAQSRVGQAADNLALQVDVAGVGTTLTATVYVYGTLVTP